MYKIEKYLIEHGHKLKRSYESGCLVYAYCDEDGFYGDEVVLFPNHKPNPAWEIHVVYPFDMCIPSYRDVYPNFIENCKENLEEHLKANIAFNKKMLRVKNPWSQVE